MVLAALLVFFGMKGGMLLAGPPSAYQLKTAYLYHFTKFVQWPATVFADERTPFRLCVVGVDPFGKLLDVLSRKKVKGRSIVIRRLESAAGLTACHLLFVSQSEEGQWQKIFSTVSQKPVLTVSDTEGFARRGGMVNFVRIGNKLRFEIEKDRVAEAGLKMSATMLQVGQLVKSDRGSP